MNLDRRLLVAGGAGALSASLLAGRALAAKADTGRAACTQDVFKELVAAGPRIVPGEPPAARLFDRVAGSWDVDYTNIRDDGYGAGDTCIECSLVTPLSAGDRVTVSLRPERVQIGLSGHTIPTIAGCRLAGTLREVIYLGDHVRARVALPGNDDFTVKRPIDEASKLPAIGDAVELAWAPEHCRAFAREDEAV